MRLILLSFVILFTTSVFGQKNYDYESAWKKVETLLNQKGLPNQALDKTNEILQKAIDNKDQSQIVKGIYTRGKLLSQVSETPAKEILLQTEKDFKHLKFPYDAMVKSELAKWYYQYLSANYYVISQRTEIKETGDDFDYWSEDKFVQKITEYNDFALSRANELSKLSVSNYPLLVYVYDQNSVNYYPSLMDLIAKNVLQSYSDSRFGVKNAKEQIHFEENEFFGTTSEFLKVSENYNSEVFINKALSIYRLLTKTHSDLNNTLPLAKINLERLDFIYNHSANSNKEELFMNALKKLFKENNNESKHLIANRLYTQMSSKQRKEAEPFGGLKLAHKMLLEAINEYPKSFAAPSSKTLIEDIETENLTNTFEKSIYPNEPFLFLLNYKNLEKIKVEIYEIPLREEFGYRRGVKKRKYLKKNRLVRTWIETLPNAKDYYNRSIELKADGLEQGLYAFKIIGINNNKEVEHTSQFHDIYVSRIAVMQAQGRNEGLRLFVMDRNSGKPISGLTAKFHEYIVNKQLKKLTSSFTSDKDGQIIIPHSYFRKNSYHPKYIDFVKGQDSLVMSDEAYYSRKTQKYPPHEITQTQIYLDRAIYRPGQTVYFKGIYYEGLPNDLKIKPNQQLTIILRDVNNQEVETLALTTDKWGTISGTFTLPTGLLNGNFSIIISGQSSAYFKVEEYKRPQFEVKFDTLKESKKLNDQITISGFAKTYTGIKIAGAKVKYHVTRQPFYPYWGGCFWWRPYPRTQTVTVESGESVTDKDGNFKFEYTAIPDKNINSRWFPSYNYSVNVEVISTSGETISNTTTNTFGTSPFMVTISTSDNWNLSKEDNSTSILVKNSNGVPVKAKGKIIVYELETPNSVLKSRYWAKPDTSKYTKKQFKTWFPNDIYMNENELKEQKVRKVLKAIAINVDGTISFEQDKLGITKNGNYKIEVELENEYGKSPKVTKFIQCQGGEKGISGFPLIIKKDKIQYKPNEKAIVSMHTDFDKIYPRFEVDNEDEIREEQMLDFTSKKSETKFKIIERDKGNVYVKTVFVKNNRPYTFNHTIPVPHPSKQLYIKTKTFRDKLQPNEHEKWTFEVKDDKGNPIKSQGLFTMYDASLDELAPLYWNGISYQSTNYVSQNWGIRTFSTRSSRSNGKNISRHYLSINPSRFNYFDFYFPSYANSYYGGYYGDSSLEYEMITEEVMISPGEFKTLTKKVLNTVAATRSPEPMIEADRSMTVFGMNNEKQNRLILGNNQQAAPTPSVRIRKKLGETAFFFPNVETNEKGVATIEFDAPEALTKWKVKAFFHDETLMNGQNSFDVTTYKKLMVKPYFPRFVRHHDKVSFSVSVASLTEEAVSGQAKLRLYHYEDGEKVYLNDTLSQSFSVEPNQSVVLDWEYTVPNHLQYINYEIIAYNSDVSDGEADLIPVLPSEKRVVETFPMYANAGENKTFDFERLRENLSNKELRDQELTLEYYKNPNWLVALSLPFLLDYNYNCSEQITNKFYAAVIADELLKANPDMQEQLKIWREELKANPLKSELEQKQELKSVLLEATPFVQQSNSERENRAKLVSLFDTNYLKDARKNRLREIIKRQLGSGGFPWFPGGKSNRYITQYILQKLLLLKQKEYLSNEEQRKLNDVISKAAHYVVMKSTEDYLYAVKHQTLGYFSSIDANLLYTISNYPEYQFKGNEKKMYNYLEKKAEELWVKRSIHQKAWLTAWSFRTNRKELSKKIIASIKDYALKSDEMGFYWQKNKYSAYESSIERQSVIIDVFKETNEPISWINKMQQWLLQQKRTQSWESTTSTSAAVDAFISPDKFNQGDKVKVKWNDEQFGKNTTLPSDSYILHKTEKITKKHSKVEVNNPTNSTTWGALFWTYTADLTNIEDSGNGYKASTKFFKRITDENGQQLIPLEKDEKIEKGDVIVARMEVSSERDYEYVHLQFMRPAGFEPMKKFSGYESKEGLWFYNTTKDVGSHYFFDRMPKGKYVFEVPIRAAYGGSFKGGNITVECLYAPDFRAETGGELFEVE